MMRLHARAERRAIELHHREQIVLVRDGDGGHALRCRRVDQLVDAHDAVDQRVLGVQAQMDERRGHAVTKVRADAGIRCVEQLCDGLERAAVQRARLAASRAPRDARASSSPCETLNSKPGIVRVELHHQRVAGGLGEDRCGADGRVRSIAADDGLDGAAQVQIVDARQLVAVHLDVRRAHGKTEQRAAHGEECGLQDVDGSRSRRDPPSPLPTPRARSRMLRREHVALFGRELLRVRQPANGPVRIENHRRSHDRPRERPPPRLIDAGDAHAVALRSNDAAHDGDLPLANLSPPEEASRVMSPPHTPVSQPRPDLPRRAAAPHAPRRTPSEALKHAAGSAISPSSASPSAAPVTASWKNSGTRRRPSNKLGCEKYGTFTSPSRFSRNAVMAPSR